MFRKVLLTIILASTMALAADDATRFKELEDNFICVCGCNMGTLNMCTMVGCSHGVPMRAELKQMIAEGKSDEQITAAFVDKYGGVVRSTPTTSGFDLTAWVIPFVALAAGMLAVAFVVRKWRSQNPEAAPAVPADAALQSRVEEELRKYTPED